MTVSPRGLLLPAAVLGWRRVTVGVLVDELRAVLTKDAEGSAKAGGKRDGGARSASRKAAASSHATAASSAASSTPSAAAVSPPAGV